MTFCARLLTITIVTYGIVFTQNIKLNEVMFDLEGVDYHDEYLELINLDSMEIDPSVLLVGDQDEQDALILPPDTDHLVLMPGEILLVLDGSYPGNSTAYDSLINAGIKYVLINDSSFGKSGFSNSVPEYVVLINTDGDTLDKYQYTLNNDPGFSDEKILAEGPNIPENWDNSKLVGGTPGYENSVASGSPMLIIQEFSCVQMDYFVKADLTILGLISKTEVYNVQFWADLDFDGLMLEKDAVLLDSVIRLDPFQSVSIDLVRQFSGYGSIDFKIKIQNTESKVSQVKTIYWKSENPVPLILNEILISPVDGEPEWIELFNMHSRPLKIAELRLVVNADTLEVNRENSVILAHNFLMLSQASYLPPRYNVDHTIINHLAHWENLRITEERIMILDPYNKVIDSLSYDSRWWENDIENISLEKKSVDLTNNMGAWGKCRNDLGATPGIVNSWKSGETDYTGDHIQMNSLYFNPESGHFPNFLEIGVKDHGSGLISVKIYDIRGRIVKNIARDRYIMGKEYFIWNGVNENNQSMPSGTYIVFVHFSSNNGDWVKKKAVALFWGK